MASNVKCGSFVVFNALAMAFLAPRGVPMYDIAFVFGMTAYALIANTVADKPLSGTVTRRSGTVSAQRSVRLLFPFTLLLSIGAPWALLVNDMEYMSLLAPSLFLIHAQLALETVTFACRKYVSVYVRIMLPIAFVSYRIDSFCKLLYATWFMDSARVRWLRAVGVGNLIFWLYSLLGYLLPYVVPRSFRCPDDLFVKPESDRSHRDKFA